MHHPITHSLFGEASTTATAGIWVRHAIGIGHFQFDFASIDITQLGTPGASITDLVFVPQGQGDRDNMQQWLGAGFALEDHPLIIKGPIPIQGPGYFMGSAVAQTIGDKVELTLVYRRLHC